jgi:hypothetical protein
VPSAASLSLKASSYAIATTLTTSTKVETSMQSAKTKKNIFPFMMSQINNIPQAVFQVQQSGTDVFALQWHNLMKAGAEVQGAEAWKS